MSTDIQCIALVCLPLGLGTIAGSTGVKRAVGMMSGSLRVRERLVRNTAYIGAASAMAGRDHRESIECSSTEKSLRDALRFRARGNGAT